MEKTIVTGGSGFIGSHLCDQLLSMGKEIIIIDNFYTGRMENIEHLKSNPKVQIIEHDIVNPISISDEIDEIYNLACPASPKAYQKDPIQTLKTNFIGNLNMLELAREKKAKFLLASTSEVYGDPEIHPQTESYKGNVNTVGPRSCYDEGKRVAESLVYGYKNIYGVDARIIRIFNTYGPRMDLDDGRVVSNFIRQALNKEPLTIYGDGKQTRSLCYVSDMVAGIIKMMDSREFGPINLGNSNETTILQIADNVQKSAGTEVDMLFENLPIDDPVRRCPDISLAKEKLSWEPKVKLEDGLRFMIEDFKSRIK